MTMQHLREQGGGCDCRLRPEFQSQLRNLLYYIVAVPLLGVRGISPSLRDISQSVDVRIRFARDGVI